MPYLPEKRPWRSQRHQIIVPRPVITQPGGMWFGWLLFTIALIAGFCYLGVQIYQLGGVRNGNPTSKDRVDLGIALKRLDTLTIERDLLRAEVIQLERNLQIDREAAGNTQQELLETEKQRLKFKEEVAMLQSLVSGNKKIVRRDKSSQQDGSAASKLLINSFSLHSTDKEQVYKYKLEVALRPKSEEQQEVKATITVNGQLNGQTTSFDSEKLRNMQGDSESITLKFRSLTTLDRELVLPEGFQPSNIEVKLVSGSGSIDALTNKFPWQTDK